MRFSITRASFTSFNKESPYSKAVHDNGNWFIEINTIDELLQIFKETGQPVIVTDDILTIYDDYIE